MQPNFVTFDSKERESFLSQHGTFTPGEREIFHKLCRVWENQIPYNRFMALASPDSATAKPDLEKLMKKLSAQRMGLITSEIKDGARAPVAIILCEADASVFFERYLEERLLDTFENLAFGLPSTESLATASMILPEELIKPVDYELLAQVYLGKKLERNEIHKIPINDDKAFFVPSHQIKRYVTLCLSKVQFFFQNSNLLAAVASLRKSSLMEIRKQITQRDPSFWLNFSDSILQSKKDFEAQRKIVIPEEFFPILHFLNQFVSSQMAVIKEKQRQNEERILDYKTIEESILEHDEGIVTDEEYQVILSPFQEKYGDDFSQFLEEFEKKFTEAPERKNLPIILKINDFMIHQNNIPVIFRQRVEQLASELFKIYVPMMRSYLKNRNHANAKIFYSNQSFENDIHDKVKELDDLLNTFFQKPNAIAEALILKNRKQKGSQTVQDMKMSLVNYFYSDNIRFKELSIIFKLDLHEIFSHAFLNLSIFRQILMRITGKYESYHKQFLTESLKVKKNQGYISEDGTHSNTENTVVEPRQSRKGGTKTTSSGISSYGSSGRTARISHGSSGSRRSGSKKKEPKKIEKKKAYSKKEQDQAWDQFGNSLKQ